MNRKDEYMNWKWSSRCFNLIQIEVRSQFHGPGACFSPPVLLVAWLGSRTSLNFVATPAGNRSTGWSSKRITKEKSIKVVDVGMRLLKGRGMTFGPYICKKRNQAPLVVDFPTNSAQLKGSCAEFVTSYISRCDFHPRFYCGRC